MTDLAQPILVTHLSREEEADLVVRIGGGDQSACTRLVRLFGPQMMTVARRFLRCDDDCDDALQDAFISAFKAIAGFECESRLATWLYRITVNSCLMKLRSDWFRREISIEELLPATGSRADGRRASAELDDPLFSVETDELRAFVHRAIEKLPAGDRAVLLLRDIEQMDAIAAAAVLETSVHNVKRRLRRARQVLSELLEPHIRSIRTSNTRLASECI